MKVLLIVVVITGVAAVLTAALLYTPSVQPVRETTMPPTQTIEEGEHTPTLAIGNAVVALEVVDTPAGRTKGLSGRTSLEDGTGMLFVFETPTLPNFWMKDMHFGIDIVWMDADGVVVGLEEKVSPETYPQTFSPPHQVMYVLEVPAGWVDDNNIHAGDRAEGSVIK